MSDKKVNACRPDITYNCTDSPNYNECKYFQKIINCFCEVRCKYHYVDGYHSECECDEAIIDCVKNYIPST